MNQDRSLVCLMFVRPSQNWNHMILDTMLFVGAENTKSWHARKGDLQCAFPLDVSMVH
jgi:hypothetical protein